MSCAGLKPESKAPFVRMADRYAFGFVGVTAIFAILAWLLSGELERARRVAGLALARRVLGGSGVLARLVSSTLKGIEAQVIEGLTGVWTSGPAPATDAALADPEAAARKIGSIGVHVRRGVTTHGFAINVSNDLQPFEWIVPCGIEGCRMTSVCRELGSGHDMAAFMDVVTERFAETFELEPVEDVGAAAVS